MGGPDFKKPTWQARQSGNQEREIQIGTLLLPNQGLDPLIRAVAMGVHPAIGPSARSHERGDATQTKRLTGKTDELQRLNRASSLVGTIGLELTSGPIPLNTGNSINLIPRLAIAYQVDALASELGNSSLAASMPASGSGTFLTQGQNRGVNGLSIAAGADLVLSKSTALYATVNVETFSAGSQVGYGGGFRFRF